MINFCKILIVSLLIFNPNLFAQKNIYDYVKEAYNGNIVFEYEITNTRMDSKNHFLEFSSYVEPYYQILLQAKMYNVREGNNILLIVTDNSDMQCTSQKIRAYEIDEFTDKLKPASIDTIIKFPEFDRYVSADTIEKKIYSKYKDSLADYLGTNNNFPQFMEELYDYKVLINRADDKIRTSLILCDYMDRNIVGFNEEDQIYLKQTKTIVCNFNKKKKLFSEKKK